MNSFIFNTRDLPTNQVFNFDAHLPLTSTWKVPEPAIDPTSTTAPKSKRIAPPRKPLPAESSENTREPKGFLLPRKTFPAESSDNTREPKGFLPKFAKRLNPFKKKDQPDA